MFNVQQFMCNNTITISSHAIYVYVQLTLKCTGKIQALQVNIYIQTLVNSSCYYTTECSTESVQHYRRKGLHAPR